MLRPWPAALTSRLGLSARNSLRRHTIYIGDKVARLRPPCGAVPPNIVAQHEGRVPPRHARQQVPARVYYGLRAPRPRLRPPAARALHTARTFDLCMAQITLLRALGLCIRGRESARMLAVRLTYCTRGRIA